MKKRIITSLLLIVMVLSLCAFKIPDGVKVETYDKTIDYMSEMEACAKEGTKSAMLMGVIYETQRNLKIESEGMYYGKTNFFTSADSVEQVRENVKNYLTSDANKNIKPGETPAPTPTPELKVYYTDSDATMIAKVLYRECGGVPSKVEQACVAWVILNRVDNGRYGSSISAVITAPSQFAWSSSTTVRQDLLDLAYDVLNRWNLEKNGYTDVGRVLPSNYLYFHGDGRHNYFKTSVNSGYYWDYSLPSPY